MSYRYSEADADEILAAIPALHPAKHRKVVPALHPAKHRKVILAIEAAASGFVTLATKRKPTALQVRTRLNTVRIRASMVLAHRRYLTDNFLENAIGEAAFRELQRAAARPLSLDEVFALPRPALRQLAEHAIARMDRRPPKPTTKPTMARYEGYEPLQWLIEELLGIWIELYDSVADREGLSEEERRLPGTSPLHSRGGPFLSFATACLTPVSRDCPTLLTERQIQIGNLRARFRRSSVARAKRWALKKST